MESITGVPADAVGQVVQDFVNDGAVRVVVEREEGGAFTVTSGTNATNGTHETHG
jgi:hypothetical protein